MSFSGSSAVYQDGVKVWFDGTKAFWRARATIDVVIALHIHHDTIEIVPYNATFGLKAPRIYLRFSAVKSCIDPYEFNTNFARLKEESIRARSRLNTKDATIKVTEELCLDYIFNRLDVIEGCTTDNFIMVMHALPGDHKIRVDGNQDQALTMYVLEVVRTCPQLLIPVTVNFRKVSNSIEVRLALKQLRDESLELQQAARYATLLTSSTDGFAQVIREKKLVIDTHLKTRGKWHKLFKKIIAQKSVAEARERLMRSNIADWVQRMEVFQKAAASTARAREKAASAHLQQQRRNQQSARPSTSQSANAAAPFAAHPLSIFAQASQRNINLGYSHGTADRAKLHKRKHVGSLQRVAHAVGFAANLSKHALVPVCEDQTDLGSMGGRGVRGGSRDDAHLPLVNTFKQQQQHLQQQQQLPLPLVRLFSKPRQEAEANSSLTGTASEVHLSHTEHGPIYVTEHGQASHLPPVGHDPHAVANAMSHAATARKTSLLFKAKNWKHPNRSTITIHRYRHDIEEDPFFYKEALKPREIHHDPLKAADQAAVAAAIRAKCKPVTVPNAGSPSHSTHHSSHHPDRPPSLADSLHRGGEFLAQTVSPEAFQNPALQAYPPSPNAKQHVLLGAHSHAHANDPVFLKQEEALQYNTAV